MCLNNIMFNYLIKCYFNLGQQSAFPPLVGDMSLEQQRKTKVIKHRGTVFYVGNRETE